MPRPLALALAAGLLAGCGATPPAVTPATPPTTPPAPFLAELPRAVAPDSGHALAEPLVLPFTAAAGTAVVLRATVSDEGLPPTLCLASAEGWARYRAGTGEADAADLAGDALACNSATEGATSELAEVLPRAGRYVVVAANEWGGAPSPFALEPTPGDAPPLLAPGAPVADTLEAPGRGPARAAFAVDGRAGERIVLTASGDGFAPYLEVGAWAGEAYTPILGTAAAPGDTAVVSMVLPADGRYTVRVTGGDAGAPVTVRAARPAAAGLAALAAPGDPAERYALIVSVADYPGVGAAQAADLVGPTADGAAVRALLTEAYGFRPENVLVLRDAEATREAVVDAFRTHLGQAGSAGTALFHYAGHGTQLPAEALPSAPDEADGLDEALVLWGRGGAYSYLLDHELGALAEGLAAGHTVLILDNCHSGDGTRGEGRPSALRLLPYHALAGRLDPPADLLGPRGTAGAERHVLLAAARDAQPSLELAALAPDGGRAGVFTTALVQALRDAGPDATFADVVAGLRPRVERMTRTEMAMYGYDPQEPQVEGAQATARVADALGPRR